MFLFIFFFLFAAFKIPVTLLIRFIQDVSKCVRVFFSFFSKLITVLSKTKAIKSHNSTSLMREHSNTRAHTDICLISSFPCISNSVIFFSLCLLCNVRERERERACVLFFLRLFRKYLLYSCSLRILYSFLSQTVTVYSLFCFLRHPSLVSHTS